MIRWFLILSGISIVACDDGKGKKGGNNNEEGDTCDSNNDCESDLICYDDACEDIFDRNFEVIIASGEVSTSGDWDTAGGAPDPFVYFAINNDYCYTSTESNTFYPTWNESCRMVVASGGTFEVIMFDEDISYHDTILTYSASGNDDLADLIRDENVVLSNSYAELIIRFVPAF
jgi:hypothetical protein